MSVWKSDETLLSICILNFSFKNDFVWEEISNIRHCVSSPDKTPRSSSKILRCASYFQLSSRCFIWWWNTASHVWYITLIMKLLCMLIKIAGVPLKSKQNSWFLSNFPFVNYVQQDVFTLISSYSTFIRLQCYSVSLLAASWIDCNEWMNKFLH